MVWAGFWLIVALKARRMWLVPDLFLYLLLPPVALAISIAAVIWIGLGFKRSSRVAKSAPWTRQILQGQNHVPNIPNPADTSDKYYQLLSNAFSQLDNRDWEQRLAIYNKVRTILSDQLSDQGKARAKVERRALETAIAKIDAEQRSQEREEHRAAPASTVLLVFSLIFPGIWIMDLTCVSLYWIARLPKVRP
jgi:hypothetical protein